MTTRTLPEVDPGRDIGDCVGEARRVSAGAGEGHGHRGVGVITPGGLILAVPCPAPESVTANMLAGIRAIVPPEPKVAITVIACNEAVGRDALTPRELKSLIPFLGYLLGFAFDGHTVVVFEGHPSALEAGCRDADVVLVDQAVSVLLPDDWVRVVGRAMQNPRILVFHLDGSIASAGPDPRPREKSEATSGRMSAEVEMRIGDQIRAGRFTAAASAAAAVFRRVMNDTVRAELMDLWLSEEAYKGFIATYFGVLGARDGGHVEPTSAAAIDTMLEEFQGFQQTRGMGHVSRYSAAFFLLNLTQLLPVFLDSNSPGISDGLGRQVAALADVLQDTLGGPERLAPPDGTGPSSGRPDRAGRRPWWRFW